MVTTNGRYALRDRRYRTKDHSSQSRDSVHESKRERRRWAELTAPAPTGADQTLAQEAVPFSMSFSMPFSMALGPS